MLLIKNLKKAYENFNLNIDYFNIEKGKVVALVGRNGVGKSTTIKSIMGLIKYDSGEIFIDRQKVKSDDASIKQYIGYIPENINFYQNVKGKDVAEFLKKCYENWDSNLFCKLCERFKIDLNKRIKELSKGNIVKMFLVFAVSHHPRLLILDEPTSGLDPIVRNQILEYLEELVLNEKTSILFSSHIMDDVNKIADRVVYINNGKIILSEDKAKIINNYRVIKYNDSNEPIPQHAIAIYKNQIMVDCTKNNNIKEKSVDAKPVDLDKVLEFIVEGKMI